MMSQHAQLAQTIPRATPSRATFMMIAEKIGMAWKLPIELLIQIHDTMIAMPVSTAAQPSAPEDEPEGPRGDPSIPPSYGTCLFLKKLPMELRTQIYSDFLISKHIVIKPQCELHSRLYRAKVAEPRRNQTSDLMVLCKHLNEEVATVVYQERTFEIHVHEGITGGGIEFLDAGRQQLQYLSEDYGIDTRFTRFREGEEFGFNRLKKIKVVIFSKTDPRQERHTAMNTYFMNLALAQMLQRSYEKDNDRITSFTIEFNSMRPRSSQEANGRHAIMQGENQCQWWDANKQQPLSTEIHDLSDIELILRPFSILRRVHNVNISLPSKIERHTATMEFVNDLRQTMMGPSSGRGLQYDGSFEMKANAIKHDLYDNHVYGGLWGSGGKDIGRLTEKDMQDAGEDEEEGSTKHQISPTFGGDFKRHKGYSDEDDDEIDEIEQALWAIQDMENKEKERKDKLEKDKEQRATLKGLRRQEQEQRLSLAEKIKKDADAFNRERLQGIPGLHNSSSNQSLAMEDSSNETMQGNFTGQGRSLGSTRTAPTRTRVPPFISRRNRFAHLNDEHAGESQPSASSSSQIGNLRVSSSGLSDMVQLPPPSSGSSIEDTQDGGSGPEVRCGQCGTVFRNGLAMLTHMQSCRL